MADSFAAVHELRTFAGSDKSGSMQCEQCMLTACSARNAAWCAPTADKAQSLHLTESDVPLSDLQAQVCELVKLSLSALAVKILDCTRSCSGVVFVDCGPASLTDEAGTKATRCLHVAGHAFCAAYKYCLTECPVAKLHQQLAAQHGQGTEMAGHGVLCSRQLGPRHTCARGPGNT